jgi:hypothetical protein
MAWCKELVLVVNRALFKLVDNSTKQIMAERRQRELVLRHYFDNDNWLPIGKIETDTTLKHSSSQVLVVNDLHDPRLFINMFNKNPTGYYALSLASARTARQEEIDGLFVYTNLNRYGTLVVCTDLVLRDGDYLCYKPLDLYSKYGYSAPPNELGRDKGLKFIHVTNLTELAAYTHMLIQNPHWPKSKDNHYQAILKLDWYTSKARVHTLRLPALWSNTQIQVANDRTFNRYYLDDLGKIHQAYEFNKVYSASNCDSHLAKYKAYALLSSSAQVRFTSANEFVYSQILSTKSKNLTLKLTKNTADISKSTFIDIINFDIRHLLLDTNKKDVNQLVCTNGHTFEVKPSFMQSLGQIVRFYLTLMPAFVAFHLQLFSFLNMTTNHSTDAKQYKKHFLILNACQTDFRRLLNFGLVLTLLGVLCTRIAKFQTDFDMLMDNGIWTDCLVPILYAISYGILSFATFIFSIIFFLLGIFLNRLANFVYNLRHFLFSVYFAIILCSGLFASAFVQCLVFYGELINLACDYMPQCSNKHNTAVTQSKYRYAGGFVRLFLLYLLIVINMPALLVWIKSVEIHGFKPSVQIIHDPCLTIAVLSSVIYLMGYLKRNLVVVKSLFRFEHAFLTKLILANAFISVMYSCFSLHRLPYFILTHLFLMLFADEMCTNDDTGSKRKLE